MLSGLTSMWTMLLACMCCRAKLICMQQGELDAHTRGGTVVQTCWRQSKLLYESRQKASETCHLAQSLLARLHGGCICGVSGMHDSFTVFIQSPVAMWRLK